MSEGRQQLDLLAWAPPEAGSSMPARPQAEVTEPRPKPIDTQAQRDRMLIIDGDNFVRRYFHAPSNRTAEEAIGFGLGRLQKQWAPSHAVVVFDDDQPTWRHQLHPGYKANRPPRPDGLDAYMDAARAQCKAWRIAHVRVEAVEADDLIASYADAAARIDLDVLIVSGDKDLLQLVRDEPTAIRMVDEIRGRIWRPSDVHDAWGAWPHSFADLLALIGDRSDGYEGVPKIGKKTAAPLLETHGGLEQLLERIELVSRESVRERLRAHADDARKCLQLATLRRDLRLPVPIAALEWRNR